MVWAACLVHDAVTLQKLLELLETVAQMVVTPDSGMYILLSDDKHQMV